MIEAIIAFILFCAIMFPGSRGSGYDGIELLAMSVSAVLCLLLLYFYLVAPFWFSQKLDDYFGPNTTRWYLVCVLWYGGAVGINYWLAVRDERKLKALHDVND